MKKKMLSILISTILLVCVLPMIAAATESTVTNVADETIVIETTVASSVPLSEGTAEKRNSTTIDAATISLIMSSITAIAAIVAPTISAIMTIKSNEKIKQLELHSPKVYDAVNRMISSYSKMPRLLDDFDTTEYDPERNAQILQHVNSAFSDFRACCYEVIALIPNVEIHQQIASFINIVNLNYHLPEEEAAFRELVTAITLATSPYCSKQKKHICSKRKGADAE